MPVQCMHNSGRPRVSWLGVHRGGVVRDLTRRACTAGRPFDVAGKIDPLTA
jgi:hypothetical protein